MIKRSSGKSRQSFNLPAKQASVAISALETRELAQDAQALKATTIRMYGARKQNKDQPDAFNIDAPKEESPDEPPPHPLPHAQQIMRSRPLQHLRMTRVHQIRTPTRRMISGTTDAIENGRMGMEQRISLVRSGRFPGKISQW